MTGDAARNAIVVAGKKKKTYHIQKQTDIYIYKKKQKIYIYNK